MTGSQALPPFRAVIFDMDGLVLDTERTYCAAWSAAAREMGQELNEDFYRGLFGQHAGAVEQALMEVWEGSFDRERFMEAASRHWYAGLRSDGIATMPGALEVLGAFERWGIPYALATNSDGPYARLCLESAGLAGRFPIMVTRDQVTLGKPAPDVFLEAARRLGVAMADCVVLEDSATGLAAASAAGAIAILIQADPVRREEMCPMAHLALTDLLEFAALMK